MNGITLSLPATKSISYSEHDLIHALFDMKWNLQHKVKRNGVGMRSRFATKIQIIRFYCVYIPFSFLIAPISELLLKQPPLLCLLELHCTCCSLHHILGVWGMAGVGLRVRQGVLCDGISGLFAPLQGGKSTVFGAGLSLTGRENAARLLQQ